MMAGPKCGCLVCRLEASLISELDDEPAREEFRSLRSSCPSLSAFPTAQALIEHLHRHEEQQQSNSKSDSLLGAVLGKSNDPEFGSMVGKLLLLTFVPSLHRTVTQIAAAFPTLARDDTAQHLFAALLEFLSSSELRSRRSHLAFTIARKMRRSGFRWAIRESKTSLQGKRDGNSNSVLQQEASAEDRHAGILLRQFLDTCERRGWLSFEERYLLTRFKLEQVPARDLVGGSGHSVVAMRHRLQRLVSRLRRIARQAGIGDSEQLGLFSR
jgi:hypothetical protein